MIGLDINTEKGQVAAKRQKGVEARLSKILGYELISTPIKGNGVIDGFFHDNLEIHGIFEIKCRGNSYEQFKEWGTWLVTEEKVNKIKSLSKDLNVPGYFIVETKDRVLLIFHVTNNRGKLLLPFKSDKTFTQATVNGGFANRQNAFFKISDAIVIE